MPDSFESSVEDCKDCLQDRAEEVDDGLDDAAEGTDYAGHDYDGTLLYKLLES